MYELDSRNESSSYSIQSSSSIDESLKIDLKQTGLRIQDRAAQRTEEKEDNSKSSDDSSFSKRYENLSICNHASLFLVAVHCQFDDLRQRNVKSSKNSPSQYGRDLLDQNEYEFGLFGLIPFDSMVQLLGI